jgi:phage-related protein
MAWRVLFFQTTRGDYPVKEFNGEQNSMLRSKIALSILLLKNQGPFLKPPYIKKLQDKLYELRISGTSQIRIFYTIHHSEYYLLHAFKKKTQKTPAKELKVALDRMKELV